MKKFCEEKFYGTFNENPLSTQRCFDGKFINVILDNRRYTGLRTTSCACLPVNGRSIYKKRKINGINKTQNNQIHK